MITFHTANGRKWSCPRHDHDHIEGGGQVPCAACWPVAESFVGDNEDRGAHAGYALRSSLPSSQH